MVDAEKELHEKVTEAMKALLDEMETRRNESLTSLSLKTNIEAKLQTIDQFIYRCEAAKTSLQDILTIKSDERLLDMEHSIKIAFPQYVCPNKLTVDVGTLKSTPKSLGILGIDVEMNIQLPVLRNVSQEKDSTKLEFAAEDDSQTSTQTVSMSIEKVQDKLHQLFVKENLDNEAIFEWIEECVDEITVKSNKFIRALMTAVCESTISGGGSGARVLPEVIKNRVNLLQTYLDHQAESELQALYALQALVHRLEHPQDGFHLWEKSRDPNEQEEKGAVMKEVVLFFTWLREADEDLSDS
ncbi:eukaryotic translation initiation factor 4 gamma 3-like isoform X2 [Ostrea edulis]|uniref:eukaryotic translation initiation factor 4 gamma 3-like isoform X2 n=1 Tax=Ostrea edulis TaxID=37623 RepID=UPI0024AF803A|nr:eukaryotic translation initiation factor 4 gamma 3-like isoform X2 [Ostrea edulis]